MPVIKLLANPTPQRGFHISPSHTDFYDHLMSVVVIGDSGVGKSCLVLRATDDTYTESYISTIGVDFKIKNTIVANKHVKIQVWDSQGGLDTSSLWNASRVFRRMRSSCIILAFDLTDFESFQNIREYLQHSVEICFPSNASIVLVGNKADLPVEQRQVSSELIDSFLACYPNIVAYAETSAKNGANVDEVIDLLVRDQLTKLTQNRTTLPNQPHTACNRELDSHLITLRDKVLTKSLALHKANVAILSDPEIIMWKQKIATLEVASKIVKGDINTSLYDFYKTKYSNPLHTSGTFAKTPQLLAQVEAMLPKNEITKKAELQAQIEVHIDELHSKINTAPRHYGFWQRDNRAIWQSKIEVLQAAKLALIAVDFIHTEAILALEEATSQNPLYKKGLFSKTDKYVSQVFELQGHSRGFTSNL